MGIQCHAVDEQAVAEGAFFGGHGRDVFAVGLAVGCQMDVECACVGARSRDAGIEGQSVVGGECEAGVASAGFADGRGHQDVAFARAAGGVGDAAGRGGDTVGGVDDHVGASVECAGYVRSRYLGVTGVGCGGVGDVDVVGVEQPCVGEHTGLVDGEVAPGCFYKPALAFEVGTAGVVGGGQGVSVFVAADVNLAT